MTNRRRRFWIDTSDDGSWGVECDDKSYTADGHFACIVGRDDKARERASEIADILNTYLPPKKD